jgi:hypothetical protein
MNNNMSNNMNNNFGFSNNNVNINPNCQSTGYVNMNNLQQQQPQQQPMQQPQQQGDEPQGYIRRSEETVYDTSKNFAVDADVRVIVFEASTGLKVVMNVDGKTTTIKDLIKRYINKIGISETLIGNGILFLMNGKKMDHNSENLVSTFPNTPKITVFDQNNVIGA